MRKPLAALLSALLLAGCVDAPPTTPQVKQVGEADMGLTGAAAPHFPQQWWKAFNDPQVDRLADQVVANNPTLAGAMARMRAAQAELSVQRADDRPQVTLDGSEQRTLFSKDYIIPPPFGGTYRWYGSVTADLSWNLDFWGKQADQIAKARSTAEAAALDTEAARLALSGSFAQTYINLLLNYQNGDIADQAVAERTEILKITQGRFDAGLENGSSVEQAKTLLSVAKADQLRFAAAREMDIHAIAALAGLGAGAYAGITRPAPNLDVALPLPEKLPADLLARRPDILAAKARVDAGVKGRDAAHKEFYPDINLAALAGFQAIGMSSLFTGNAFTMGIGPAIHLPIFDAGKIRAQYAGATAQLDIAVADYNGAVVNAIKQTADAMTQVRSLAAQRQQQQDAVTSAERAFRIAEDRYRSGLDTQLPMLTTEATLLQTRQALVAVAAQGAQQRITLLLTVGGGFDPITPNSDTQIAKQDISHD
ncbi:MAG TPA: efflux transporter outer membrane subunit [Rhizomicrobium sp.]|jgi:NodT family efflux transporter outer membrane factor (OMF) lipoprotein